MKKLYISIAFSLLMAAPVGAKYVEAGDKPGSDAIMTVTNIVLQDNSNNMVVDTEMDFSKVNLQRNKEVIYTPFITNGTDTLFLTPFSMAGHNRYIWAERNGQLTPVLFKGWGKDRGEISEMSVVNGLDYTWQSRGGSYVDYCLTEKFPYQDWMEVSTFGMKTEGVGCSDCPNSKWTETNDLAMIDLRPAVFQEDFIFVTPVAETVKTRELSGRAFVDFKVNKTDILPDYRNNRVELGKIIATIDSVKNDKDITVTSIQISGTASPEGSYENNVRLAKGRTEALTEYVSSLYHFPQGFIKTSYQPVDWAGLKEWLENNQIENREAILNIVDGDLEPYARNQKIKTTYPKQYAYLLENVYPALRHSDYVIEYNIRNYANVDEIIEVMTTAPQKLSLNELFIVANAQPEGSDLYNESFEIAVKMYPNDEVANLNAATVALMRGDSVTAERLLKKAGKREEAEFTRGEFEALHGDKDKALQIFKKLADSAESLKVREKASQAYESLAESMRKGTKFIVLD